MAEFTRPTRGPIRGIHHITGLVGSAANDLRFYRDVLGLRLVKKTCNQENPTVTHTPAGDPYDLTAAGWFRPTA